MTGRSHWLRLDKHCIPIAINEQTFHLEIIPRHFSFFPQSLSFATPKMHIPRLHGLIKCILIHKSEHEDRAISPILNHRGDKPMFIKLEGFGNLSLC